MLIKLLEVLSGEKLVSISDYTVISRQSVSRAEVLWGDL